MFQIRPAQADILADEDFIRRAITYLHDRLPESVEAMQPEDLRALVRHTMEVARSYALVTERGLMNFLLDMLGVGPNFHLEPHINGVLGRMDLAEDERLDRLVEDVDEDAWAAAGQLVDPETYWDRAIAEMRSRSEPS